MIPNRVTVRLPGWVDPVLSLVRRPAAWLIAAWFLFGVLAFLSACAVPVEEHGGLAPHPAAPDLVFAGAGFALDGALATAKVPTVPRVVADAVLMWAVRVPRWGGRTESAHLLVFAGAFTREWLAGIWKAVTR